MCWRLRLKVNNKREKGVVSNMKLNSLCALFLFAMHVVWIKSRKIRKREKIKWRRCQATYTFLYIRIFYDYTHHVLRVFERKKPITVFDFIITLFDSYLHGSLNNEIPFHFYCYFFLSFSAILKYFRITFIVIVRSHLYAFCYSLY